jgi:hypothetical protein
VPIDPGDASDNPRRVSIIVPQGRANLAELVAKAFEGREDVTIMVDRRRRERRTRHQPVAVDRRRAERRRPKAEVFEVVIESVNRPGKAREGPA